MTAVDMHRDRRGELANTLAGQGDVLSEAWRSAVETVPRHVFVPSFWQQVDGRWKHVSVDDPEYLDAVYGDVALTTQVTEGHPTSSSSQPSLMLRMLEALDVQDGHTVLEVGTGTGYNAALLSERLGSQHVVTCEVAAQLAREAEARLAACGYTPTVTTGDGRLGYPSEAPYDRLIATCGLDRVPHTWVQQMKPGGVLLCPLGTGNVRLLVDEDGTASGRYLPEGSYFMKVRRQSENGTVPYPGTPDAPAERTTDVDCSQHLPEPAHFVLSLVLPEATVAAELDEDGNRTGYRLWARDGSWAQAEHGRVRQHGPRQLWDVVERSLAWWDFHGQPDRERFGATVTRDKQVCWLDDPSQTLPCAGELA